MTVCHSYRRLVSARCDLDFPSIAQDEGSNHAGEAAMNKERLTAFSDGVIAIIITIMVCWN